MLAGTQLRVAIDDLGLNNGSLVSRCRLLPIRKDAIVLRTPSSTQYDQLAVINHPEQPHLNVTLEPMVNEVKELEIRDINLIKLHQMPGDIGVCTFYSIPP